MLQDAAMVGIRWEVSGDLAVILRSDSHRQMHWPFLTNPCQWPTRWTEGERVSVSNVSPVRVQCGPHDC